MLAEHPEILQRLREEILQKVGPQRRPTHDDFKEMKFLRAVINGKASSTSWAFSFLIDYRNTASLSGGVCSLPCGLLANCLILHSLSSPFNIRYGLLK
jgi:hypothetical protein